MSFVKALPYLVETMQLRCVLRNMVVF